MQQQLQGTQIDDSVCYPGIHGRLKVKTMEIQDQKMWFDSFTKKHYIGIREQSVQIESELAVPTKQTK